RERSHDAQVREGRAEEGREGGEVSRRLAGAPYREPDGARDAPSAPALRTDLLGALEREWRAARWRGCGVYALIVVAGVLPRRHEVALHAGGVVVHTGARVERMLFDD